MSATSAPFGLRPVNMVGGSPMSGAGRWLPMTADTGAIYKGALAALNAGTVGYVSGSPTSSVGDNSPIGVVMGVRYKDPTLKQTQFGQYLPANAITAGYTEVWVNVADDPNLVFEIQATGQLGTTQALAWAKVGLNAQVSGFSGSATTTVANTALVYTSPATNAAYALRIVGFVEDAQNSATDAYPVVLVKINQGVHRYTNATGR